MRSEINNHLNLQNPIRVPNMHPNMQQEAMGKEFNQPVLLKFLWQFQMFDWQFLGSEGWRGGGGGVGGGHKGRGNSNTKIIS